MSEEKIYKAAVYVRLSKEDGDKVESNSISNQKEYIKDFLKEKDDVCICSERIDDGYSGVNFDRPAFNLMIEDIKSGKINCVVVKDLSRFGRNYIESGRYIERIFPFLGVRFIAINDNYDSAGGKNQSDSLIIPFKNLMNDEYAKDISIKIRSHLDMKRRGGQFIGSFATYGYMKTLEDKNKLEVDEYASKVIQDIFKWKLFGMSGQSIASKLNELGILSPMEYKEDLGLNYTTSFKINNQAKWTAVSVSRILKNEIYIGVMEQGKESTPNYKIKTKFRKPKEEWFRVENNHESIISVSDFNTVKHLLMADTRIAPNEKSVYLFSGVLKCGDCHRSMVRKTVPSNKKKYIYYVCSTNKADNSCSSHRISNKNLEDAVFYSIKAQIDYMLDLERILEVIEKLPLQMVEVRKLDTRITKKQEEIQKYKQLKISLYEDQNTGFISQEEYEDLKEIYTTKCEDAEEALTLLKHEIDKVVKSNSNDSLWIEEFKKYSSIHTLNRKMLVTLIDHITIFEGGRIDIVLNYQDVFERSRRNYKHGENK